MTVSVIFLVGRVLFAVPLVLGGADRLVAGSSSAVDRVWALLALVGAAGVVIGAYGDVAALVAALALAGHGLGELGPRGETDEARVRRIGLVGGAVCVCALFVAVGSALDLTATGPVVDLDLR